MQPIALAPNLMTRPYRGGSVLASFRPGVDLESDHCPEDWMASTTCVFGHSELGLTRLPDGTLLRSAIEADPSAYLGEEHVGAFDSDTGLLVKLIDAQQRLSIHAHPSRAFSRAYLGCPYGKTEAWYVLSSTYSDAHVYLGFKDSIELSTLLEIVESGRGVDLLESMNKVPVTTGDTIVVPAGTPHAIGEGILLVEVQEPSDLLVRLEWVGYQVGTMPSEFGLGFAKALGAVDASEWSPGRLETVVMPAQPFELNTVVSLLRPTANPFFRLEGAFISGSATLQPGFSVLIVAEGSGELQTEGAVTGLHRGDALLTPWAAGPLEIAGNVTVLRARPASADLVRREDPALTALLAVKSFSSNPQSRS